MKLSLTTHGGWSAALRRPPLQIDTARLAPEEAAQVERLVEAASAERPPPRAARSGADAQTYVITCEDAARTRELRGSDLDPHPAFEALRTFIAAHAG
jgi:hypothetical protein